MRRLANRANDARAMFGSNAGHRFSIGKKLAGKQGAALFYYAGHALQIEWHDYLMPLSTRPGNAAAVAREALDASRDNPFSGQASGRGLAQMDAPPYATSPGNVADDGTAGNGLYTQYLPGELRKPAVKIEDIFKRTRLAVRTASGGRQIPWESTSLEEDFYFQPPAKSALSPEELEPDPEID